jgi:hypothetical protein
MNFADNYRNELNVKFNNHTSTPKIYTKARPHSAHDFDNCDTENIDPESAWARDLVNSNQNLMDKLNKCQHHSRLKCRENTVRKSYHVKQRRVHRKASIRAADSLNQIRDSVMNPKKLRKIEEIEAQCATEMGPHDKQVALSLKHMRKGLRYTSNHIIMEQEVRAASKCAASNVAASINAVAASIADEPFTVQCSSPATVLRNEQLQDMLSLIIESAIMKHADNINIRWDLSPQNSMELLATWVSFTVPNDAHPEDEDDLLADTDNIIRTVTELEGTHCRVVKYCLPVVQCCSKEGVVVGDKVKWLMELSGDIKDRVSFITTDHGSENGAAIRHAFGEKSAPTTIYCGIHALNLALTYGCDTFDDKAKKEKMTNKCLTHLDFVINLLRRYWGEMRVHLQDEFENAPWVGEFFSKASKSVRTRWLSCMLGLEWLLPKIHIIVQVIEKYMLKGSDGKIGKRWRQALKYLKDRAHLVKWKILLVAHREFFQDALSLLQSNHGYNAMHMPDWVGEWDEKLLNLENNVYNSTIDTMAEWQDDSSLFDSAIDTQTILEGGDREAAEHKVSQMVQSFFGAVRIKLRTDLGFWNQDGALEIATLLQVGAGRDRARKLVAKYKECPRGVPKWVWRNIKRLCIKGDWWRNYREGAVWLEALFMSLCCHNTDPERTFNVVGAYLKKAPNAKQYCISAHTRNTFNRTKISPEFLTRHRKRAKQLLDLTHNRVDFEGEVRQKLQRKFDKVGETTREEINQALRKADEEALEVHDLPHGDTLDGVVLVESAKNQARNDPQQHPGHSHDKSTNKAHSQSHSTH